MERWQGKIAVVTGASAGIGAAILKALAQNGLIAVGLARRVDAIQTIAKTSKGVIHAVKCDLSNENEIIQAFQWIESNLGGVDLLINNAGVCPLTTLSEGTSDVWRNCFEMNVIAVSLCTREALKTLRKRGDNGHIIHINSILGHRVLPIPNVSMYAASKHALRALARSLRLELNALKSSIKVTVLSPGLVHTDMSVGVLKGVGIDGPSVEEARPENALDTQDLAEAVVNIISMKPHVQIDEMMMQSIASLD